MVFFHRLYVHLLFIWLVKRLSYFALSALFCYLPIKYRARAMEAVPGTSIPTSQVSQRKVKNMPYCVLDSKWKGCTKSKSNGNENIQRCTTCSNFVSFMIVYNYDADLEVSHTCVRSSLLSWVEFVANILKLSKYTASVMPLLICGSMIVSSACLATDTI